MKKMADIMNELGFCPEASDDVKKAFIKNLIRAAHSSEFQRTPTKGSELKKQKKKDETAEKYEQISLFDQKLTS